MCPRRTSSPCTTRCGSSIRGRQTRFVQISRCFERTWLWSRPFKAIESYSQQVQRGSMRHFAGLFILSLAIPAVAARTVTDELGRTVTVPDHPHRLVCLAPSVVDDVYALGAGADVVAVTDYVKYPAESRTKLSVGLPLNPSIEAIVSLHPDLVLGFSEMSNMDTMKRLEQLGIAVFMVTPHGIEGIYRSL